MRNPDNTMPYRIQRSRLTVYSIVYLSHLSRLHLSLIVLI